MQVSFTIAHTVTACGQATTTKLYVYHNGSTSVVTHHGFNYQQSLHTQLASAHGKARRVLRRQLAQAIKYNF